MRLTKHQIEQTAKRLIKHRFSAAVLALRCKEAALFRRVWLTLYTGAQQELLTGAPEGFFGWAGSLRVNIGGQQHDVQAWGSGYNAMSYAMSEEDIAKLKLLPSGARVAMKHTNGRTDLAFQASDSGLPADILACAIEVSTLSKQIKEALTKAEATLTQLGTRARALAEWPELEPFLPKVEKVQFPAVPVADLNALFELP